MTLRVRRGTNAQRLTITPDEGEVIYTTDTKNVYIGDGTTVGGVLVTGGGIVDGSFVGDVKGSLFADDSTIMVDGITGNIYAIDINATTVTATTTDITTVNATAVNVTTLNSINGNIAGIFVGDITGSVFADDSTVLVDALDGTIRPGRIIAKNNDLSIYPEINNQTNSLVMISNDAKPEIIFQYKSATDMSSNGTALYGAIYFGRNDAIQNISTSGIFADLNGLYLGADITGGLLNEASYLTISDDKVGIGTYTPAYKLDVDGDGHIANFTFTTNVLDTDDSSGITITPAVTISSDLTVENDVHVTNTVYADRFESTTTGTPSIEAAVNLDLTAGNAVRITSSVLRLASFTTTNRDLLAAQNGDIIYNTSANKFQGYENGVWVNLI
jgi:hypothetical protein